MFGSSVGPIDGLKDLTRNEDSMLAIILDKERNHLHRRRKGKGGARL